MRKQARQKQASRLRRYWVAVAVGAIMALAFGLAAEGPAWAAPPAAKVYQTVPKPTATPDNGPVATATPRPDDDDDDDDGDDGGSVGTGGQENTGGDSAPVFFFAPEEASADLSAVVTVATLNVREGPDVTFPAVGVLRAGDEVQVLARNEENTWWQVCCVPGTSDQGWVSAQLVEPKFDRAQSAGLISVFGARTEAAAAATPEPIVEAQTAKLPLVLKVSLDPPIVWQGQTADLILEISNPNLEDARNVELSDQLPAQLELVNVFASDGGRVSEQTTPEGATLILARWNTAPASASVRAVVTVKVAEDLEDGEVFDNLAAVRGANAAYATGSLSIGMPPKLLPDFQ